jgi:hypothetical protein
MNELEINIRWKIHQIHLDWVYFVGLDLRLIPTDQINLFGRYEIG